MRYQYDELTGHRCIYNHLFAIGWLPNGQTHWIWEWPYIHVGLRNLQICFIAYKE